MSTQFPSNSPQQLVGIAVKTADYNVALSDNAWLLVMNSSSAHTFTLLATPPTRNGWFVYFQNIGTGVCTIARNGNNIDGAASNLTLNKGDGVFVGSDGTTYYTVRGQVSSGAVVTSVFGRTGAVTAQTGDYTVGQVTGAEATANKDAASGYAGLDSTTHLKLAEQQSAVDARTTTSEAIADADRAKLVTFSNGSAVAATIAQAGASSSFTAGWFCFLENIGAGTVTLTPTTSTIDGAASLVLTTNKGVILFSDGSNYFTVRGFPKLVASDIPDISATYQVTSAKDAASGYAGLDSAVHLSVAEQQETVDARTTTSEAIADADRGKVVTLSNTSAVAATIAQAGASSLFTAGWWCDLVNLNTGTVTLTPTTSTINGAATLVLQKGEGGRLLSDGSNYIFVAGQPTIDTPSDADVLTYEAATKRWRSKNISVLGGANASQLRGNNISSATPGNQNVLKWITADNQYDLVLADGMEHGDAVWPVDSAWVGLRDEFIHYSSGSTQLTGTQTTDIGELGWILVGNTGTSNNAPRFQGGIAPNIGTVSWTNNATAIQFGLLELNDYNGSTTINQNAYALFENAGWKLTWVFKFDNEISQSTAAVKNLFQKKSMYIGLMGAAHSSVNAATQVSARPDIFFGVRLDTSTVPQGFTISSVAAGTGVYTAPASPGILGAGSNAFAGMNATFVGFANAANNGTFPITASSTTTLTVTNASSVAETVSPTGSAWVVVASIPSTGTTGAASGGNTVYNVAATGFAANQLQGLTFVVTGGVASGGANNGTFTCVANTTTTITLNNGSGVAETHALFLTGGNLNDTTLVLEAVQNQTFATGSGTPVRHNIQGTTVNGPAPDKNWHRLDVSSTTAGQIVIQLDGSNTYKLTYSVSSMTFTSNGNSLVETTGQQLSYSSTIAYTNSRNSGVPCFAAGSAVTLGAFTGGSSGLNGSYTVEAVLAGAPPVFILPSTAASGQTIQQSATTIAGLPAVTPCAIFGNDDTQVPYVTTRFFVDFFALVWNKAIASPSTVPAAANPRYW